MQLLSNLTNGELRQLAAELSAGRLAPPYDPLMLSRWLNSAQTTALASQLSIYDEQGLAPRHIALLCMAVLEDRSRRVGIKEFVDLVATSPLDVPDACRDTSAVVQSLFAAAEQSVDVVGYAIYQGREVFRVLADRMQEVPALRVRMFLNVVRPTGDTSAAREIVRRFAQRFVDRDWPAGKQLPELFYDPRAVDADPSRRASLHAKVVVVDDCRCFISSANFTEAGHQRNIEIGVRLESDHLARELRGFLDVLLQRQTFVPILLPASS
jgi:phosphatidylserine/phosphatidylglycerophosphate/cardiolipin synthase-like enzyme